MFHSVPGVPLQKWNALTDKNAFLTFFITIGFNQTPQM